MNVPIEDVHTFVRDVWPSVERDVAVSWGVELYAGTRRTRWEIHRDFGPVRTAEYLHNVVTMIDGDTAGLTSYCGSTVRSSMFLFDRQKVVKLAEVAISGLVLPTLTNLRENHHELHARSKVHKKQAWDMMNYAIGKAGCRAAMVRAMRDENAIGIPRGLLVRITRVGKKLLDHDDNLPTSAKHVRDGIAKALGFDDGHLGISWHYDQRKLSEGEAPGVKLELFERGKCEACGQYRPRKVAI